MIPRRVLLIISLFASAASCFLLGVLHARREGPTGAASGANVEAIRAEVRRELQRNDIGDGVAPAGTAGVGRSNRGPNPRNPGREKMVAEIKQELTSEMGLLPLQLLRARRSSFVELYSTDNFDKTNYGTAGYLGHGYFITVKHAVVALNGEDDRQTRKIAAIKIVYSGKEIPARLVDAGDADVEVHNGDWAIIKTRDLDLPSLRVDTSFPYEFADPIFRLGNDYSKGIILSTGYVGQKTSNGLVTCLTDGHPGVSGGGVLDQSGDLVGIPIGRMQGDYRFSFILPLRAEMLRKVPSFDQAEPRAVAAELP